MRNKKKYQLFFEKHANLKNVLLGVSAVMLWRGVWDLMDVFLFPHNIALSATVSIIIGSLFMFLYVEA